MTFLYQLTSGSAGQSYGLNVARLAQIPHSILRRAAEKSKHLENICKMRRLVLIELEKSNFITFFSLSLLCVLGKITLFEVEIIVGTFFIKRRKNSCI